MFANVPILVFKNSTELIFTTFLWFPINFWQLLGPAQLVVAAIFGAIGFVWIIILPYLGWRLIKYIAKNKVQSL